MAGSALSKIPPVRAEPVPTFHVELLGEHLRRQLIERIGFAGAAELVRDADPAKRRHNTAQVLARIFQRPVAVRYRPDGRPEVDGGWTVSASHAAGLTLAAAGPDPVGCDLEAVAERDRQTWGALLGSHLPLAGLLAAEADAGTAEGPSPLSIAATRVWSALEALQKVGQLPPTTPLTPAGYAPGRWAMLAAGPWRVATVVVAVQGIAAPLAVAVATR